MTKEQAQFIVDAILETGEEANVYENYSGRGMYGDTTTGVVTDLSAGQILAAVVNQIKYSELDPSEIVELDENVSQDSMGRGIIIY
jgi:hypothetical protein